MSDQHRSRIHYDVSRAEATGAWAERRRLASAMRDVVEHLVTSEAPEAELRAAADALERYAERLRTHPTRSTWEGFFREAANAGDVSEFFDFSPLMGRSNPIAPPSSSGSTTTGFGVGACSEPRTRGHPGTCMGATSPRPSTSFSAMRSRSPATRA
jgi:hypothetical protein